MEKQNKINIGLLKELIKQDFTKHEIANLFNCSWNLVDKVIFQNNLPKPARKRYKAIKFTDETLLITLKKYNGNVNKTAQELDVSNIAVYNRLKVIKKQNEVKEKQEKWLSQTVKSAEEN